MALLGRYGKRLAVSQSAGSAYALNLTSRALHRAWRAQAQRQENMCLVIGPFKVGVADTESGRSVQLGQAGLAGGLSGLVLAPGAEAHSCPWVSPAGQSSVFLFTDVVADTFQWWLRRWGRGPGWQLGLGVAFTPLTLPSHGCPALLPFQPWDQRWAGRAMLGFTPPTLLLSSSISNRQT